MVVAVVEAERADLAAASAGRAAVALLRFPV